jgi:CelD/BcsL family acetyltransferase involved in cellulose biosynthesis
VPSSQGSSVGMRPAREAGAGEFRLVPEFLTIEQAARLEPEWRALFDAASDPNPFLGPDFFLPLVRRVAAERLSGVLVLRRLTLTGLSELAAFFPYRLRSKFPLTSHPVVEAFAHPFVSDSTPLVRAEGLEAAARGLIDALERHFTGHVLVLDGLRLDGRVGTALQAAAASLGLPIRQIHSHERATLRAGLSSEAYLRGRVSGKKLRELRRCEKRLSEHGPVEMTTLAGSDVPAGVREFLGLEASGWKGKRGTALASNAGTRGFAEAALGTGDAPATVVDVLKVGGKTIAAAIHLVAGPNAVAFKCAYDESWARMSPGTLLDLRTLRFALDERRFAVMDSCAVPGHPVEALWCDRIRVGEIAIGLGAPCDEDALEAFVRRQQKLSAWKADAKALAKRLQHLRAEISSGSYFGRR